MNTPARTRRRRRLRALLVDAHLWLGLSVGAVFALAGLTGAGLVFYLEIDAWLEPGTNADRPGEVPRTLQEMFVALRTAHPERARAWRLELPLDPTRPVTARYYRPDEKAHLAFAPLIVTVDPVTLRVGPARFWGEFAMTWFYDLHYTLLLDRTGRNVLAIVGAVLLLLLGSGLWLWWPRRGRASQAFSVKWSASRPRVVYDLHKALGAMAAAVLLVVVVTGVMLEVPGWVDPALGRIAPMSAPAAYVSGAGHGTAAVTLDEAVAIARGRFPHAEVRWIETPDGPEGTFRVNLHQPGEPGRRFPRTNVWIDQYSGAVLGVRDAAQAPAGDTILAWLHPLHSGEAFGLAGRLIVLVSGLVPPALLVTGIMRWRHRRRATRRPARTASASARP